MIEFYAGIIPAIQYVKDNRKWPTEIAKAAGSQFASIAGRALSMGKERVMFHLDGEQFIENCQWAQGEVLKSAGKEAFDRFLGECRYAVLWRKKTTPMISLRYSMEDAERFVKSFGDDEFLREIIPLA